MSNLHKQNTVKGLKWSGIGQVIKQVLNISIGILLARLLTPQDFGLLGMITVFTGFMQLFNDFGFGAALIQKSTVNPEDLNSVFWFNLLTGCFLFGLLFMVAPLVAQFYETPRLVVLMRWISTIFVIQAFTYVQLTLFKKQLDFKVIFWVELIALVLGGITALTMAWQGFGVYSLVAQLLVNAVSSVLALWWFSSWRPSFQFSSIAIKSLLNYSFPLMGSSILGYILGNLDKLLIGRFLGNQSLGIYTRAYSLMVFPVGQISGVISQVMFPSLAQIQNDKERIKSIYLKMNRIISFVTFPLMALGFILAEPFILIVLGEQWREMIPIFKIFTIVGALQSIGTLIGNIFMALGEMKLYFKVNLFSGIVFVIASFIGIQFSVLGVTLAYCVASISLGLPQWYITGRLIQLNLKDYIGSWIRTFIICAVLVLSLALLENLFFVTSNTYVSVISALVFILLYAILMYAFNRNILRDFILKTSN